MKHTARVTATLVFFFLVAQIVGLFIINEYIDHQRTAETKKVSWEPLPYNLQRPEVENESTSFISIFISILLGTALLLFIVKINKPSFWRAIFFVSIMSTLSFAFYPFVRKVFHGTDAFIVTGAMAILFSLLKLFRPNVIMQNIS